MTPTAGLGSSDLRVQRTRKLILDALIELTIQKGFAQVTVRDITRQAGINRATFYRHYQDKFDLLDQYAQAVYDLLDTPASEALAVHEGHRSPAPSGLVRMLEHLRTHARFYRVMLGQNGDPGFAERIRRYVEKRLRRSLPEAMPGDAMMVDFCLSYMSSASVGAILWWLDHEMPYAPEELAALSYRLTAANLQAVFGYPAP